MRNRRDLAGSTVVVTGASSGVGRAAALGFARKGADVVLAARSEPALHEAATECRRQGVRALVVPTDVGRAEDVDHLAQTAVDELGGIDTWVNAAAVLVAGVPGDESAEEVEQIVRTNVLGAALASRAAFSRFRQQGHGVLVDVASLLGVLPSPFVPFYVSSKFAVRGLSLSLHHLSAAWPGIRVCVVVPGPIDTPFFQRGANHTGRRIRAIAPAISPERVAAKVVACAERPRRQATIGFTGHALLVSHRLAPRLTEWLVARGAATLLVDNEEGAPHTEGEIFDGGAEGDVSGGWRRGRARRRVGDALGRALSG